MQKMKNGLMMFCLTVLLSCAVLMMNTPTASAMTLADIHGDYRITDSYPNDAWKGMIIAYAMEDGELIGRVKKCPSTVDGTIGYIFMKDVYVDNGNVYAQVLQNGGSYSSFPVKVFSNGATLQVINTMMTGNNSVIFELHKM